MAKKISVFFCKECGYESSKWMGQCPSCKEWNSFSEEPVKTNTSAASGKIQKKQGQLSRIQDVSAAAEPRFSTGFAEMDRVLGGGIVQGSLGLLGGDPGIGKSTLLLQACRYGSDNGKKVLYISGEESARQIKMRADRIGTFRGDFLLLSETNLDRIEEYITNEKPQVVVIDSIQT
ncbi:MAG: AAA family ATPase, partial [Parasporobacterium sp.]|nr:AAA family ATPase [Parasporobacterium sp.]